ncbi:PREDICTED: putative F-box protein At1g32420 [Tarenaya hassleriana]|uniref:putative F-box protein At1g32420 n=1 Tax=Tarenaya hassleriana TaxID=28532 RepID=UPI00053C43D0|nr:PREDICTED: putative F-box protein At1g32420 [Tarenaya hassleriana]
MSGSASGELTLRRITDQIPHDLMTEILLRLPAKSLARFLCVSKTWASTIRSRDFANSFVTRSSTRPTLLAMVDLNVSYFRKFYFFSFPHRLNPDDAESCRLVQLGVINSGDPYTTTYHSVRGLICLETESGPVICNPSLNQFRTLPETQSNPNIEDEVCFLGYDPVEDNYKVLLLRRPAFHRTAQNASHDIRVLTLGDREWRRIEGVSSHVPTIAGRCINGVLFYGTRFGDVRVIVSFDVKSERINFITAPNDGVGIHYRCLTDYKGKLALCGAMIDGISLLVLEDAEKHEWSCKTFALPHSWRDFLPERDRLFNVKIRDSGDIIVIPHFFGHKSPAYVLYCNPERISIKRVDIEDALPCKECNYRCGISVFTDHVESLMFL